MSESQSWGSSAECKALWDAINAYATSCGGDPATHVYGNTSRMKAVAMVESVVHGLRAQIATLTAERDEARSNTNGVVEAFYRADQEKMAAIHADVMSMLAERDDAIARAERAEAERDEARADRDSCKAGMAAVFREHESRVQAALDERPDISRADADLALIYIDTLALAIKPDMDDSIDTPAKAATRAVRAALRAHAKGPSPKCATCGDDGWVWGVIAKRSCPDCNAKWVL